VAKTIQTIKEVSYCKQHRGSAFVSHFFWSGHDRPRKIYSPITICTCFFCDCMVAVSLRVRAHRACMCACISCRPMYVCTRIRSENLVDAPARPFMMGAWKYNNSRCRTAAILKIENTQNSIGCASSDLHQILHDDEDIYRRKFEFFTKNCGNMKTIVL